MAALILSVAGAAIGGEIGGPWGARAGWIIGGLIGGGIDAPKLPSLQGPRMGDLSVQSSAYGQSIPLVYGTARLAGNVIWSTNLIETATSTTQSGGGGKGGGGSSQTTTSYTYSASFAVAMCEGPIGGVLRIWADGKLIYDVSASATTASVIASNASAHAIRIYPGSATQAADPLIQSYQGAANTPAYRDLCYLVFDNLQLANFGNRIPNITAEICATATTDATVQNQGAQFVTPSGYAGIVATAGYNSAVAGVNYLSTGYLLNSTQVQLLKAATRSGGQNGPLTFCTDSIFIDNANTVLNQPVTWNPSFGTDFDGVLAVGATAVNKSDSLACIFFAEIGIAAGAPVYYADFTREICFRCPNVVNLYPQGFTQKGANAYYWQIDAIVGNPTVHNVYYINLAGGAELASAVPLLTFNGNATSGFGTESVFLIATSNYLFCVVIDWVQAKTNIYKYFAGTNSLVTSYLNIGVGGRYIASVDVLDENADVLQVYEDSGGTITRISAGVPTSINSTLIPHAGSASYAACAYSPDTYFALLNTPVAYTPYWWTVNRYGAGQTLSAIVADLCGRSGVAGGDYDVTALTDTVHGYIVSRQMAARAAIGPLQSAFYFDAIESDAKLKFVKRGGGSAVTIQEADLAALDITAGSTQELPDLITPTRTQELELPKRLNVNYFNLDADYQQGSQYADRLISQAVNVVTVDLAVVLHDAEAAKIAEVLLYDAWMRRETAELRLTRQYANLDPADVITVVSPTLGVTFTLRIVSAEYQPHGLVILQVVPENAAVYSPVAAGASANSTSQSVSLSGPARLELMDVPLLRDQDDGAGFYAAACGYLPGWKSATLFKSADAGATWGADGYLSGGIIGVAQNALAAWSGGNVWDLQNSLTIKLVTPGSSLSSATELAVYNGANVLVAGGEVLQFQTATLNGDGTYTLSRLLRYRKGSEITGATHAIGERCVLTNSSTAVRVSGATAEIGAARTYRAVTTGATLASASDNVFTAAGNGLKPLQVVNVGVARDASSNLTIQWQRRGRLDAEWRDYIDIPIGETAESYSVDILSYPAGIVVRTIAVGAPSGPTVLPSVVYTAAQQIADFGSTQAVISFSIYQISASAGRGFARTILISSATFDPAAKSSHIALSGGNLIATPDGTANYLNVATTPYRSAGNLQAEVTFISASASTRGIGLAASGDSIADGVMLGISNAGYCYRGDTGTVVHNGAGAAYGAAYGAGDVVGILWNANTIRFMKNGLDQGVSYSGVSGPCRIVVSGYTNVDSVINLGATPFAFPASGYAGW